MTYECDLFQLLAIQVFPDKVPDTWVKKSMKWSSGPIHSYQFNIMRNTSWKCPTQVDSEFLTQINCERQYIVIIILSHQVLDSLLFTHRKLIWFQQWNNNFSANKFGTVSYPVRKVNVNVHLYISEFLKDILLLFL
jgi:hypothetical protein